MDHVFNCGGPIGIRLEGIKYTSPTVAGFIFDATIGEALKVETFTVDNPSGQLTNVGRVMGWEPEVRRRVLGLPGLAAGVGGEYSRANEDESRSSRSSTLRIGTSGWEQPHLATSRPTQSADNAYIAGALSVMHVPSGLFAQGHYTRLEVGAQNPLTGAFDSDKSATRWDLQVGIAKNWFGIGNTRGVRRV